MKKIGIVTWHKNGNYGGTLQAYAMSTILKKMGYIPEFINYCNSSQRYMMFRHFIFNILYPDSGQSRKAIWLFVKKYLRESPLFKDECSLRKYSKNEYDIVICGSDQIWSCVNGIDPLYFLQFADKAKRVAYAPSIGLNSIKELYQNDFNSYVNSIPHLSVREQQGAVYIKKNTGRNAKVVLDPTLLLDCDEWLKIVDTSICERSGLDKTKYILCYFLGNDAKYKNYVTRLAKKTGLPVRFISTQRKTYGVRQIICNPLEFVELIANAGYVLTDSFHATIFSLNLGTEVGIFKRFCANDSLNQNSRIFNITSLLGVEDRILDENNSVDGLIDNKYDNQRLQIRLDVLRQDSLNYLYHSLNSIIQ